MKCDICKVDLLDVIYLEVNAIAIKRDVKYVGAVNFTPQEREEYMNKIYVHQKCWSNLLKIKKGAILEVK